MSDPARGEIWEVRFDPSVGAEIQKSRPAVVMNAGGFGKLPLVIVAPVTEWKPAYAGYSWFVNLAPSAAGGLSKESGADCYQVKSLSKLRLVRCLGLLAEDGVRRIAAAVALCVGHST